jgi:aminoglycoside 3'-phosphotransferase-3
MPDLKLSAQLADITRNYRFVQDTEGMSPARVYQLFGESETLFLKTSDSRYRGTTYDVEREKDVMLWLRGKLPVPEVLHFEQYEGVNFLLMRKAQGVSGGEDYIQRRDPLRMIAFYSDAIQRLQAIDLSDCPFDSGVDDRLRELDYLLKSGLADVDTDHWEGDTPFDDPLTLYDFLRTHKPAEDPVFSHGDLCDSNFFIQNDQISDFIDLGRCGRADRWYDIAFCVRSIRDDLGDNPAYINAFFHLLGLEPDWEKIKYHILLDELF